MLPSASQPKLRLVGFESREETSPWHDDQRARLAVTKENRIAAHGAGLDPNDPRWILAMQTQARLQGTALTPERREQLLQSGKRLGMRPFEANLVIAIVQDRARAGMPIADSSATISLVRPPAGAKKTEAAPSWPKWFAAAAAAMAMAGLLIRWFAG